MKGKKKTKSLKIGLNRLQNVTLLRALCSYYYSVRQVFFLIRSKRLTCLMSAVFLVYFSFFFFATKTFAKLWGFFVRTSVHYDQFSLSSFKSLISGFIRTALHCRSRNRPRVSLIRKSCDRSDAQRQQRFCFSAVEKLENSHGNYYFLL